MREAEQARKLAETELGKARQALDDCDQACRGGGAAAGRRPRGRGRTAARLGRPVDRRPALGDHRRRPGLDALAGALDRVGEPDAATLTETFTALTQPSGPTP